MNKTELIKKVAENTGVNQASATASVEATLTAMQRALTAGEDVALVGFGTFKLKEREARVGRNPRTGESVQIGASRKVAFKNSPKFFA